ncbi:MAG: hypothetical protein COB54_07850 [Alphaproteobacteria bacterium]|nr:MAG: hypothetical protein COB54_07850 [Alphaproteobacteria bacterium]
MTRKVSSSLPDQGLLVGWSLETVARQKIFGFHSERDYQKPSQFLEPILQEEEGHLITIAPTGTGKGVSSIIPALLRYPGPIVVIDPKGENYAVTARRRREMGQKVVVLDPFEITDASRLDRARFNPLDFISPTSDSLIEDTEMLAAILAGEELATAREVFWPRMGYQLIVFIILYQFRTLPPEKWTLLETRRIIGQGPEALGKIGEEVMKGNDEILKSQAGLVLNPADSTVGGYWAHAQSMLSFLKGRLLEKNLIKSTFSLDDIVENKPITLYLVIPPEKLTSHKALMRLWLSTIVSAISCRTIRPKTPTLMILDEAAQLGHMPQIEDAITLLRGYGVKVWSFWQDLSQIKKLYPVSWETILNNCAVQQFFGQTTELAARAVHDVSGYGSAGEIRRLDRSEMVLSIGGDSPVIVQKPNYLEDEPFKGLFDQNPFYRDAEDVKQIGRSQRIFRRHDPLAKLRRQGPRKGRTGTSYPSITREADLDRRLHSHPISAERWQEVPEDEKASLLEQVEQLYWMPYFSDGENVTLRCWQPPFYQDAWHFELRLEIDGQTKFGYFLIQEDKIYPFTGGEMEIIELNNELTLDLRPKHIADYLAFYCANYISPYGRLFLVDHPDELVLVEDVDKAYYQAICDELKEPHVLEVRKNSEGITDYYRVNATVLCGDTLSRITFGVHTSGCVDMDEIEVLFAEVPTLSQNFLRIADLIWREKADTNNTV